MKAVAIFFAIFASAVTALGLYHAWPPHDVIAAATLVVLALTLLALIVYAYDTNRMARAIEQKWLGERPVMLCGYEMALAGGSSVGDAGRTVFKVINQSSEVVRAVVQCNLRVYGTPVVAEDLYSGKATWLVFPAQASSGWFEIASLVAQQGKTVDQMRSEARDENQRQQLTMMLELDFRDESGNRRKLPARSHYFDFRRWVWIPQLAEGHDLTATRA